MALQIGTIDNHINIRDEGRYPNTTPTVALESMTQSQLADLLRPVVQRLLDEELRRYQRSRG